MTFKKALYNITYIDQRLGLFKSYLGFSQLRVFFLRICRFSEGINLFEYVFEQKLSLQLILFSRARQTTVKHVAPLPRGEEFVLVVNLLSLFSCFFLNQNQVCALYTGDLRRYECDFKYHV